MHRKPIILILTSRDERAGLSKNLADAIKKIGTHNVVVISDDKYSSAQKTSRLDRLVQMQEDYQQILVEKSRKIKATPIYSEILGSDHCPVGLELDI